MSDVRELKIYVDESIRTFLNGIKSEMRPELFDAVYYASAERGKRLRPILMLLSAEAMRMPKERFINLALSLEFIHSYSLVHDDLPAMDDDAERSGRPTVHVKFGEATAILAGDTLLNLAYQLMIDSIIKDPMLIGAVKYIADSAGFKGMIGGQVMDMEPEKINSANILEMYMRKTGALISAALLSPLFVAGVNEKTFEAFGTFSSNLGIAFQLADDIGDLKDGRDADKTTFSSLYGVSETVKRLEQYKNSLSRCFDDCDVDSSAIVAYAESLLS